MRWVDLGGYGDVGAVEGRGLVVFAGEKIICKILPSVSLSAPVSRVGHYRLRIEHALLLSLVHFFLSLGSHMPGLDNEVTRVRLHDGALVQCIHSIVVSLAVGAYL